MIAMDVTEATHYRVRFSCSSLPIGEDTAIVSLSYGEGYFKAHLHNFFSDHAIDVDLGCLGRCDVIEYEDIFLVIGLNDQLILAIRKIDTAR